jgi:hypothetical protein
MMKRIVAANLTGLRAEPSWQAELLTQVTNGVELEILQESGEWCRARQSDGYEGWAYAPYLTDAPPPPATHMVCAPVIEIAREPNAPVAGRLLAGTRVQVLDERLGWAHISPVGSLVPNGWTPVEHLRPLASLPLAPDSAREHLIAYARRFTGVYYLWGGCSAWGIDCSGLVQLVHRLCGYEIPRDARLQFPAGRAVEPPFHIGDLLFFHSETDPQRITHVGLCTGHGRMVHSSRRRNGVYEEEIEPSPRWRERFAGARSFLP